MANSAEIKFKGISDMELAQKVMKGEFGNGAERQAALGDRYTAVQNIINNGMQAPLTETVDLNQPTEVAPTPPAIEEPQVEVINELEPGIAPLYSDEMTDTQELAQIEDNIQSSPITPTNDSVLSDQNISNIEQATSQIQDFINQEPNPNLTPQQQNQNTAHDLVTNIKGWSEAEFNALVELWNHESGWNVDSRNSSSGAYGIPQALPASKMAAVGSDYMTNPVTQIKWGLDYIQGTYGTPTAALNHWKNTGWY